MFYVTHCQSVFVKVTLHLSRLHPTKRGLTLSLNEWEELKKTIPLFEEREPELTIENVYNKVWIGHIYNKQTSILFDVLCYTLSIRFCQGHSAFIQACDWLYR
jgi:hypothetical protein